jgi:hypothetical protein
MPRKLLGWARRRVKADRRAKSDAKDKAVVEQIRSEAAEHGVTLANDGEGGLDPALALRVFQRDGWRCSIPGCTTAQEDLDLDHIGGHPHELLEDPEADEWLKQEAQKGKQDTEAGIHVLCLRHHDAVHTRERAIEQGDKPKPLPDAAA